LNRRYNGAKALYCAACSFLQIPVIFGENRRTLSILSNSAQGKLDILQSDTVIQKSAAEENLYNSAISAEVSE